MCLIMFSPHGQLPDRVHFTNANEDNPDGIGVMSASGVRKFMGKRRERRAWNYVANLKEPFAVHFRWATHGQVCPELAHPFTAGDGSLVMHNGVIRVTAHEAHRLGSAVSDTSLFVKRYMNTVPDHNDPLYADYLALLGVAIGDGSKFVILHARTKQFSIVNESEGTWFEGLWFSNHYSMPGRSRFSYADYGYDAYEAGAKAASTAAITASKFGAPIDSEVSRLGKPLACGIANEQELETACSECGSELFIAEYDVGVCYDCRTAIMSGGDTSSDEGAAIAADLINYGGHYVEPGNSEEDDEQASLGIGA